MKYLLSKARNFLNKPILEAIYCIGSQKIDKTTILNRKECQIMLHIKYKQMLHDSSPLPHLNEVGFSVYSQNDEDGILLFIFSIIGFSKKKLIDLGSGTIKNSNTANLIINHCWTGLLIDGNKSKIEQSRKVYNSIPETQQYPPTLISCKITAENINSIIETNGFNGEVDLLSIDIDGIDYWVWKAIECTRPRVVLIEYQCIWGPEKSVTVPYDAEFNGGFVGQYGVYSGASLNAFVKLAHEKGYRLIGCNQYGYNAFFVRNDLAQEALPEINPSQCFQHPFTDWAAKEFLNDIKEKDWVTV